MGCRLETDPQRPELYRDAERPVAEWSKEYWIVGVTVTTIFETAWALRGFNRLMMDLAANPDLAERIWDIPYRYQLSVAKRLVETGVDMIWTGDDVGAQHVMQMSRKMWRRFFKPRLARFFS